MGTGLTPTRMLCKTQPWRQRSLYRSRARRTVSQGRQRLQQQRQMRHHVKRKPASEKTYRQTRANTHITVRENRWWRSLLFQFGTRVWLSLGSGSLLAHLLMFPVYPYLLTLSVSRFHLTGQGIPFPVSSLARRAQHTRSSESAPKSESVSFCIKHTVSQSIQSNNCTQLKYLI